VYGRIDSGQNYDSQDRANIAASRGKNTHVTLRRDEAIETRHLSRLPLDGQSVKGRNAGNDDP